MWRRDLPLACVLALSAMSARALDVTAGSGAALGCSGPGVRLSAAADAWLEPAPVSAIDEYGGSRYAPRPNDNVGVGIGFAELSADTHGFCIGLLYREEGQGVASRDLLDIVHADHLGKPFVTGRDYQASYNMRELAAEGLRVRRVFDFDAPTWRIRIGLGASLLRAVRGREESLSGAVTATSDSYASGTATWSLAGNNLDPKQFNPFVGAGNPRGWGFSTDVHVQARMGEGTDLDLVIMDALGRIHWQDLRRSRRVLDNQALRFDASGNRGALINGVDSRIEDEWRIPTKIHFSVSQLLAPQLKLLVNDDSVDGLHFVSFGAQIGSEQRFAGATFDLRTRAISLNARWDFVGVSLTSNRWNWQEASALGASIGIARQW